MYILKYYIVTRKKMRVFCPIQAFFRMKKGEELVLQAENDFISFNHIIIKFKEK